MSDYYGPLNNRSLPVAQLDFAKTEIEKFMVEAAELKVPLEVGLGVGDNWEQAH